MPGFKLVRNSRGVSIIEFAVVLPLFLIVVISTLDFGIYSFVRHTLQFATREGVRLALVGQVLADDEGNLLTREASIIRTVRENAAVAINTSTLQISIYPVAANYADPVGWQATQDAGTPGAYMRVKTRYDYTFFTPMISALFPSGKTTITSQATYRNERF